MSALPPSSGQTQRQAELIHTTLGGLSLIAFVLMIGLVLPVFGFNPVHSAGVAGLIVIIVCVGIGYLYYLNYRSHNEAIEQARLTDVLMNSLGQGFLTFDEKGICGPGYSDASLNLFECQSIAGAQVADILQIPEDGRSDFFEWLGILFMPGHALSFEDAVRFMPAQIVHKNGQAIELSYRPVRNRQGQLTCIVLIATDKTEEKDAQKRVDSERQFVAMVCAIFAEKQSFILTMSEIQQMLDRLTQINEGLFGADFFRDVHTIKGAAMHFKMEVLGEKLHNLESTIRQIQDVALSQGITSDMKEAISQSRAEVQLEFGRIQNSLRTILGDDDPRAQGIVEVDEASLYDFGKLLKQNNVSPELHYAYQKSLLSVPLFTLLKSLDRQMLPVAEKLEKKVKPIIFTGENIRVPPRPFQHLLMALTHVVHNILDHGIEAPITRKAKGKDPQGQVTIEVKNVIGKDDRPWIQITISDDGAGIDPNRVREKLMKADPEGSWREDDDEHVIQQLLTHDVSTRDEVSMLSGRGAGMSAVYQTVLRMHGQAELRSEMHKGTQLIIRLPEPKLPDFA